MKMASSPHARPKSSPSKAPRHILPRARLQFRRPAGTRTRCTSGCQPRCARSTHRVWRCCSQLKHAGATKELHHVSLERKGGPCRSGPKPHSSIRPGTSQKFRRRWRSLQKHSTTGRTKARRTRVGWFRCRGNQALPTTWSWRPQLLPPQRRRGRRSRCNCLGRLATLARQFGHCTIQEWLARSPASGSSSWSSTSRHAQRGRRRRPQAGSSTQVPHRRRSPTWRKSHRRTPRTCQGRGWP